jgi:hypothetical protein
MVNKNTKTPPLHRRYPILFQVSLKMVLIAVFVLCVGLAYRRQRAVEQQHALQELRRLSCLIYFDTGFDHTFSPWSRQASHAPANTTLDTLLGSGEGARIQTVCLHPENVDAALPHLRRLSNLQEVYVLAGGGCFMGGRVEEYAAVEKIQRALPKITADVHFVVIPVVG